MANIEVTGEELVVVEGLAVSYSGLFKSKDLIKEMHGFLDKKDYDKEEKKHEENVTAKGKRVLIEMGYSKEPSDYVKYIIEVKLTFKNLRDVVVTKGERRVKYNDADVSVEIKSKIKTDLAGRWKNKPMMAFMGYFINKFLYPVYLATDTTRVKLDTFHLRDTIKAFLNLYKYA